MNDIQTKFKFGDIVCSKHIGYPFIGQIYGILDAETFLLDSNKSATDELYTTWQRHAPNFANENVYYIKYNIPQRTVSWQEYKDSYENYWHCKIDDNDEMWHEKYEQDIRPRYMCVHPENDLELFDI